VESLCWIWLILAIPECNLPLLRVLTESPDSRNLSAVMEKRSASLLIFSVLTGWAVGDAFSAEVDFEKDIRPILSEKCTLCHGPNESKAGLRLTGIEHAAIVLESGARAVVPGEPDTSELLARVRSQDEEERMPPRGKGEALTEAEIAKVEQWIASGADWPKHWAYQPLVRVVPPRTRGSDEVVNPIDAFVFARLENEGLTASPQADDSALIRRLYLDLAGVLPTPESAESYRVAMASNRAAAVSRLVDDLLASPSFGERWGRHWLDRARYADSDGYEKDNDRPDAWRYRDWVIAAINADMPFDQFTIEQFAGDLLEKPSPEQILATAFNRQTLTNTEGGADKEQWRVEAVMDRVETMGAVWMGLTLTCARCHTHKYDEITHAEYYQLFSYFNNSDETETKVKESEAAWKKYEANLAVHLQESAHLKVGGETARAELRTRLGAWEQRLTDALVEAKSVAKPTTILIPVEGFAAPKGVKFLIETDQSILVGGTNPAEATYTVTAKFPTGKMTGLRLEVLPDPSLGAQGPGRTEHGNFVLNRLELSVKGYPRNPLLFGDASADYAQSGWPAAGVLDGKAGTGKNGTGWAVGGGVGKAHHLDIGFAEPVVLTEPTEFSLQLVQSYGMQHTIGRFRISAITSPTELAVPEAVRMALRTPAEDRTVEVTQVILTHVETLDEKTWPLLAAVRTHDAKRPVAPEMNVRVIGERTVDRRTTHIFKRGEFKDLLDEVHPDTLAVLPPIQHRGESGDRLDLARWLVSGENPLPPRVIANDIWMQLFGAGIVPTPEDFGVRGDRPTHPELLNWLASEFVATGWSRKQLIRTIVLSKVYQQSSNFRLDLIERDPKNFLLARQNRFRVDAEIIRDLSLSAAGLLSGKIGGPSVFPPIPAGVSDVNYNSAFQWKLSEGEDRYRRGMYTYFKRTAPHPGLTSFDCPDSNVTNVHRARSNTPIGALITLNSEDYVEAAQRLAGRVLSGAVGKTDAEKVGLAFRLCLTRDPAPAERNRLESLVKTTRSWYENHPAEAVEFAGKTLPEGSSAVEVAAWTATLRVLLNLDEFLTRS
jgi:hypothetical protein